MQQPLCSWSHPAVNREIMNIRFYLVTRSCQEVTNQSVGVCESGLNCTLWPLHAHTLNWLCIKNDVKRYRTKIYWQPQWFYLHWRMLMLVSKHPRSALFFFANVNIYIIKLNYCSLRRAEGQKQKKANLVAMRTTSPWNSDITGLIRIWGRKWVQGQKHCCQLFLPGSLTPASNTQTGADNIRLVIK